MTRERAIRDIAEATINGLNGADTSAWLRELERLAAVMPTAKERNAMRRRARDLCDHRRAPIPEWTTELELEAV